MEPHPVFAGFAPGSSGINNGHARGGAVFMPNFLAAYLRRRPNFVQ